MHGCLLFTTGKMSVSNIHFNREITFHSIKKIAFRHVLTNKQPMICLLKYFQYKSKVSRYAAPPTNVKTVDNILCCLCAN